MKDSKIWKRISVFEFIYSLAGLIVGLICIIGGIVLFLHHVTGSISWAASIMGGESEISDAAPGAILFLVGLFVVFITRFKARAQK